jgi:hypothetical protein
MTRISLLLPIAVLLVAPRASAAPRPVVVELFTSQGCSSCPPADRLLAALGREPGGAVIPLAYHVDSWNYLGWNDPFSKREWTLRQDFYARVLGGRGPYTPQAVIDGATDLVGSDEEGMRRAIAHAASLPAAQVSVTLTPEGDSVNVEIAVELPPGLAGRKLDVMAAIYETGLSTGVPRGENGGRTLHDEYVVRTLERAARLGGESPTSSRAMSSLPLAKDWARENLGVAVFVQDPKTFTIHGAAAVPLPSPSSEN